MNQVDYPFSFDNRGRTSDTTADDHIRDLIEQVLFTSPGERVNWLLHVVFHFFGDTRWKRTLNLIR